MGAQIEDTYKGAHISFLEDIAMITMLHFLFTLLIHHFQVAERALYFWNNEYVVSLIEHVRTLNE